MQGYARLRDALLWQCSEAGLGASEIGWPLSRFAIIRGSALLLIPLGSMLPFWSDVATHVELWFWRAVGFLFLRGCVIRSRGCVLVVQS